MKKLLALLLAIAVIVGCCVGCANTGDEVSTPLPTDVSTGTTADTTDDATEDTDAVTEDTDAATEDTEEVTESTDEATEDTDAQPEDTTAATEEVTTTKATTTKGEEEVTTKATTTKATTAKTTGKTTTAKTTAKTTKATTKATTAKTTTKATTAKVTTKAPSTTEKTTTTVTTKVTTTTTVTTKKTRYTGGAGTTTGADSGLTTTTKKESGSGYEFDPGDEWTLFWNDEFNGTALDTTKWTCESGTTTIYIEKEENVTVQGGNLILTARNADPSTNKGKKFTTGAVNTGNKFSFQYGRLEFRARLPYGEGVHPGLWTMGDYYKTTTDELGWPRCGEIDVMELVGAGGKADQYTESYNRRTTCNLHWGANRDEHREIGTTSYYIQDGSLADDYHIYACEWDEESITFYFDDVKIAEKKLDDPDMGDAFKQPHWIIMSFSLDSKGQHIADETTPLPQYMYVDYVRVYKKK